MLWVPDVSIKADVGGMPDDGIAIVLCGVALPIGMPPPSKLAADPNIRATMENARRGEPIPNVPETGKFFTAMDAALEAITQGRQSPKAALDGAAARIKVK